MDSNQKFWLGLWAIAAFTILALITGAQLYYNAQSDKMVVMVKTGADPIKVMCATNSLEYGGRAAICATAIAPRFPNEY
jgi:hypothetical protein